MVMKKLTNICAAVGAVVSMLAAPSAVADPIPLEYFALRDVISNVSVSPDGRHLSLMKIESRDGDPIIEIYDLQDMSAKPRRLGASPMEFQGHSWISDDIIVFSARQKLFNRIRGFNAGVYVGRVAAYRMSTGKFENFGNNTSIENLLPGEPNKILISESRSNRSFDQADPLAFLRPRAYYELDLTTGAKSLVFKGNSKIASATFDENGNPRSAGGLDPATDEIVYYGRFPGESNWREVYRRSTFDFEDFAPIAYSKDDPKTGYVVATNGSDVYGLWEFDWEKGAFGDLIFRHPEADVGRPPAPGGNAGIYHPNGWARPNELVGVYHYGPKPVKVFFDEEVAALHQQLEDVIPYAHNVSIPSMSRDGDTFVVFNVGPRDPGTYYLVRDGGLQVVGKHAPLLQAEDLADVEFMEYRSRDGRKLRGYVTRPKGEPPFPLVVMPHGGPFVGEMPSYDEWAQVLASRGYMVLQPQFLSSRGWGQKHYIDFLGQYGEKMSDDKDDGALELVRRGLVDRDRMAMFGWSYGGYASAAAAMRSPQIYQCTLPAAATLDIDLQKKYNQENALDASKLFAERRYDGLNPVQNVDKISVPMLLIHGDVDQRVPFEHFERMQRALRGSGKDVDTLVLKGADHFFNTLFYRHFLQLYQGMTTYLAEDCGPGGL